MRKTRIEMKWWRHPLEALRWWWHAYDEPDWRTRLMRPFLIKCQSPSKVTYQVGDVEETWEYRWEDDQGRRQCKRAGWEEAGIHPVHDVPGRRMNLMRRRVK